MSGVIDENGVQWEHCNVCGAFVRIEELLYEDPTPAHPYGLDVCPTCAPGRKVRPQDLVRITLHDDGTATATKVPPLVVQ
ncbi:MAG: hypothetical protein ACOYB2_19700 [Limnohabitans sp.]